MTTFKVGDQVTLKPEYYELPLGNAFHYLSIPENEIGTVTTVDSEYVFVMWNNPAVQKERSAIDYYAYRLLPAIQKPRRRL